MTRPTQGLGASASPQATALNTLLVQPYGQPPPLGKRSPIWKFYPTTYPPESGVDGLLGLSFLKHFKLTIRFRKGIIDLNKER
jgi:hypothetical protein